MLIFFVFYVIYLLMRLFIAVGIFLDILVKKRVTRKFLCDKYELCKRSITRYIDGLADGGIPIESHRGVGGGYSLPEDYKLDNRLFTPKELERIAEVLLFSKEQFEDNLNEKILEKLPLE